MHLLAATALALQLQTIAMTGGTPPSARELADSVRDADRARSAQWDFERARRARLPFEPGSGGRCDVRIMRYCWWYEAGSWTPPEEPTAITERRDELLRDLEPLSKRHPGDDWLAGTRVHYLIEARRHAAADSAARDCRGTSWWCAALLGYAAHAAANEALSDSAFRAATDQMPADVRCRWTDIRTLLPGDSRGRYEDLPCDQRAAVERRYWLLARPRLAAPANEWLVEFNVRRVQAWLAERSASPQSLRWGDDAEELLLRYGWPTSWGRVQTSSVSSLAEAGIVGHDPSPSFAFGPLEPLLDTLARSGNEGWELDSPRGESRVALPFVRRIVPISAQVARFRRGDSTLVVASFAARGDSIARPSIQLAVAADSGAAAAAPPDSGRRGVQSLMIGGAARMAGVEMSDSAAGAFGRHRELYAPDSADARLAVSDLLLFEGSAEQMSTLDSALTRALAGDTIVRSRPLGLFWETYGLADGGESVDVAVSVVRVDHGFFRSARQRLGLEEQDTPLRMRWTDARPLASGVVGRSVSIDLANLPAGRYLVTLRVTPQEGGTATSFREVQLVDP